MRSSIWAAAVVLGLVRAALATDITSCGAVVESGDIGILQDDLSCTTGDFGIRILPGGTLDLSDHVLTVGPTVSAAIVGGPGRFTIVGPGTITGGAYWVTPNQPGGTWACVHVKDGTARLTSAIDSIDVSGCVYGVLGGSDLTETNEGKLLADHAVLHNNLYDGVAVKTVRASDVDASSNGSQGISAQVAKLTNVTANDNAKGHGVFGARRLKGTNVTANRNYVGAESWTALTVTGLTATENIFVGAAGEKVRLGASFLLDNGYADIVSTVVPSLDGTTCGLAIDRSSQDWNVCP